MKFKKLVKLVSEAKNETETGAFYRAQQQAGPASYTASPIGKPNYNPSIEPVQSNLPKDVGKTSVNVIKLLGKAIQLLKNDEVFGDQMRGIMNGFKKNRKQISAYQESIVKTKPKVIDNIWGQIDQLMKKVNNPQIRDTESYKEFVNELEKVKARKDEHEQELNDVYDQIDYTVSDNEEYNDEYLEQMLTVVRYTAKRLYKQQLEDVLKNKKEESQVVPLHELDYEMLSKKVSNDAEAQLTLLEMLADDTETFDRAFYTPDPDNPKPFAPTNAVNPLIVFLNMQAANYYEAKQRYFELKRGDNYSVSIEQMYRNLPLFSFINYFSHVILKSPTISLTRMQKKRASIMAGEEGMIKRLGNIKTEAQFEKIRLDLINFLNGLTDVPEGVKTSLVSLANGPFVTRRGAANSATKIKSMLKSYNVDDEHESEVPEVSESPVKENFDQLFSKILKEKRYDEDDFRVDTMEILESLKRRK